MENNGGGNGNVAAGFRAALQQLHLANARLFEGVFQIRDEPFDRVAVAATRTHVATALLYSGNTIHSLSERIDQAVGLMEVLPDNAGITALVDTVAVAVRMINSLAFSAHAYLVFNSHARLDQLGHRDVQDGLARLHLALHLFHDVLWHANLFAGNAVMEGVPEGDVGPVGEPVAPDGLDINLVPNAEDRAVILEIIRARDIIEQGHLAIRLGVETIDADGPAPNKIDGALELFDPYINEINTATFTIENSIYLIILALQLGAGVPPVEYVNEIVQMHKSINATVVALHSSVLACAAAEVSDRAQSRMQTGLFHYHVGLRDIQNAACLTWGAN